MKPKKVHRRFELNLSSSVLMTITVIAMYGEPIMSREKILVCCSAFTDEYTNLLYEPHVRYTCLSTTEDNIIYIEVLIQDDSMNFKIWL